MYQPLRYGISRVLPAKLFIKLQFWRSHGYFPNFKKPKTFSEKIQWLKVNDRTELRTITSDKYLVRDYIKNIIGSKFLIPLYFETKDVKEINSRNISNFPCIIKSNHDSGSFNILIDKLTIDWSYLRQYYKNKIEIDYSLYSKEWQYKNIERRIIVEKLLQDKQGNLPIDFKVYCFNGVAKYIAIDFDRGMSSKCRNWYDIKWNRINIFWETKGDSRFYEVPEFFDELIKSSNKLSEPFHFLRVDWFILDNNYYIGELTHSPGGGMEKFKPQKWDRILGDNIQLPI